MTRLTSNDLVTFAESSFYTDCSQVAFMLQHASARSLMVIDRRVWQGQRRAGRHQLAGWSAPARRVDGACLACFDFARRVSLT
mmetsp:Transcript_4369/g.10694  ORF Transcript_4369/g.10694 Transcript_4369/m.10694 type:complete len:83 (-) Transcript_4369:597-845(-)